MHIHECMHTGLLVGWQFWLLSAGIVAADFFITLVLLSGVRRALIVAGKSKGDVRRIVGILGFALFGWLVLALFLAGQGVFRSAVNQPVPYIALAVGIPILVGALLVHRSEEVREMIVAVPQSQLVAFQGYRVLGVIFLVLHASGRLPGSFAWPAGYGDLFVGLTALLVGAAYERNHAKGDQLVSLWNWVGIVDLLVAVTTGFLSAPSQLQILALDAPNVMIGSFPLVMIPIYAVPLSVVLHLASLKKLSMAYRPALQQTATA